MFDNWENKEGAVMALLGLIVGGLFMLGGAFDDSSGAVVVGFIIGLPSIIALVFLSPKDDAKVIKDDILAKSDTSVVSKDDPMNSVYAGKDNRNQDVYIGVDDRAVVIGPPGTGKTSFQINQIYKWLNTGNSFVCLDIKPEIADITAEKLKEQGYNVYIYNPTNSVDKYNFLDDLLTPEAVGEFASAMIPTDEAKNAVFNETARDFLDALILHVSSLKDKDKATLSGVYDLMTNYDNITALLNDLSHSKNEQCKRIVKTLKIMADNERLLGSIFATFVSNLRFLRYDNIRNSLGKNGFSLDILQQPKTALFIQFEEASTKITGHLFSVMVGHILNYLITHTERKPVLCLFDEIGNAGTINDLTGKLNTIRSRNMPTWLYFQSKEQLQRYGVKADEGANIIFGACDFQMCFRLNDNATADWFSAKIGTQEITKISKTEEDKANGKTSSTTAIERENIIHPHELQQLADSEVVVSYRGVNWKGIAEPYYVVEEREKQKRDKQEAEERQEAEREKQRLERQQKQKESIDKLKVKTAKGVKFGIGKAKEGIIKGKAVIEEHKKQR